MQSARIFKTGYVPNEKWVIIEFIGKGAMGEVYRAHQLNLRRDVAIKVISQEMLESFEDDSEEIETTLQRFRRKVQAMDRGRHQLNMRTRQRGKSEVRDRASCPLRIVWTAFETYN